MAKKKPANSRSETERPAEPLNKERAAALSSGSETTNGLPELVIKCFQEQALAEANGLKLQPLPEKFQLLGGPQLSALQDRRSTTV